MNKKKVLLVGHARSGTGFSRISQGIAAALADEYELHLLGVNYLGEKKERKYTIWPNPNAKDKGALAELDRLLELLQPEALLIQCDCFRTMYYETIFQKYRKKTKVLFYLCLEGKLTDVSLASCIPAADRLVVPLEGTRKEFIRAFQDRFSTREVPEIAVIPHGIDLEHFFPMDKMEARKHLFSDGSMSNDEFWVLNANCNQPRKQIPLTIEGFAQFARDKPNARLWLHMKQKEFGQDVLQIAYEMGLKGKVKLTGYKEKASNAQLNLIYNACDVGINTSTGEGWGLLAFEQGLTATPQIVPGHSACAELWQDKAIFLDIVKWNREKRVCLEQGITSSEKVRQSLDLLYHNEAYRTKMGQLARENALNPAWRWPVVGEQWRSLLGQLLG